MAVTRTIARASDVRAGDAGTGDVAVVVLDAAILHAAGLRIGDQVAVDVDKRGRIFLTPLRPPVGGRQTGETGGPDEGQALLQQAS